jgi:hypothetical protein
VESNSIALALKHLMDKNNTTVAELSAATQIPASTLYSALIKKTNQANMEHLKAIADYFGESVEIFLGIDDYEPPIKLSTDELYLLKKYRSLNKIGKQRITTYAEDISVNPLLYN